MLYVCFWKQDSEEGDESSEERRRKQTQEGEIVGEEMKKMSLMLLMGMVSAVQLNQHSTRNGKYTKWMWGGGG